MDVNTLAVGDTARIHLKNAAGEFLFHEGKKVEIEIYGPGSDAFAEVEARQTQRALKRMQDNDGKVTAAAPDDRRANEAADLAAITLGFHNLSRGELTGRELFLAVYGDQRLGFIPKQVAKFVADWGNFTGGSTAS